MALQQIKEAIARLTAEDRAELANWLAEFRACDWDAQIMSDSEAGRLDALTDRAASDYQSGRCSPL